jgi:hypothetical protein
MDWTAPYLLVALGCYAALELWFVAMMIGPWLTVRGGSQWTFWPSAWRRTVRSSRFTRTRWAPEPITNWR